MAASWPAPPGVQAGTTTRVGGVSVGPYASLNLAQHVGDDPAAVMENRQRLRRCLQLPGEPLWLHQVHGVQVCTDVAPGTTADASVSRHAGEVCVVMTADCLPVLLCDQQATVVAAAHAGWRGLAAGVIPETVKRMQVVPAHLMAWLGPAIGPRAFEVGDDVRDAFLELGREYQQAFAPQAAGKWWMDIYAAARMQLAGLGITRVYGGVHCTYEDAERFYSYRRERTTGRMASLIWLSADDTV
ncbi:MAG: peptidoglycan editing factor PgeF [Gammaproteobacteria bacterium]|nr:peptidoglycan editing factor PgeF [Gammaproteobacteria bacterium]